MQSKINYVIPFDSSHDAAEYDDAKHDAATHDGSIWPHATHDDTDGSDASIYGTRSRWHAHDAATASNDGPTTIISSGRVFS